MRIAAEPSIAAPRTGCVKDRAGQHWLSKIKSLCDLESGDAEPLHELPGGASVFDSHVRVRRPAHSITGRTIAVT